jgi:hypothetical protein
VGRTVKREEDAENGEVVEEQVARGCRCNEVVLMDLEKLRNQSKEGIKMGEEWVITHILLILTVDSFFSCW